MPRSTRSTRTAHQRRSRRRSRGALALTTVAATLVVVPSASAINYVAAQNGESWAVNDGAMPGLDPGGHLAVGLADDLTGAGAPREHLPRRVAGLHREAHLAGMRAFPGGDHRTDAV